MLDEAARFRGYDLEKWDALDWQRKARVLAHFLEHSVREGYAAERAMEESKRKEKKTLRDYVKEAGFEAFRQG